MRNLSKSKIVAYRQCPKRLWLEVHKPELRLDSSATQATFRRGYAIGDIAQEIYNDGTGVTIDIDKLGFGKAFELSKELLEKNQPIFEAGMQAGGALAFADVMMPLNKKGKTKWKMIEVKSSTRVKDYYRDDVALQCYVAKNMDVDIKEVALACVDTSWVYQGDGDYRGLLYETDLTEEAISRYDEAKTWVEEGHKVVALNEAPEIEMGDQCSNPFSCGFVDYCSAGIEMDKPEFSPWILPDLRSRKVKEAIESGDLFELADVPDDWLNDKQELVKRCTLNNETHFDAEGAKKALATQKFPAYFLDFETAQLAIPIWKQSRPYQQLPFQFSLHTVTSDLSISHQEFLEMSGEDPRPAFIKNLIAMCGTDGVIYAYNSKFESMVIGQLAKDFPEAEEPLRAIQNRLVDLLPIARNYYYHPSQQGSWSIKKVLPAICAEMDYKKLGGIQDGGDAMEIYPYAISKECGEEERKQIASDLLAYCRLDTLAMVKIWEYFSGLTMPNIMEEYHSMCVKNQS